MPRPRTVPDFALLDVALALMRDVGPDRLTFGQLADRAGLAASTLVQRFGNKAGLKRAALERAWERLETMTAEAIEGSGAGVDGVVDLLVALSGQYGDEPADQLLLLREDLRDPELRARGARWFAHLAGVIDARLVPDPSTRRLGDTVVAHWQGVVAVWMFRRERPIRDVVAVAVGDHLRALTRRDRGTRGERG